MSANILPKYISHQLIKSFNDIQSILYNLKCFMNYCILSINDYYLYINKLEHFDKLIKEYQNKISDWNICPDISFRNHSFSKSCQKNFIYSDILKFSKEISENFSNINNMNVYMKMKELSEKKYLDFYFMVMQDFFEDFRLLLFVKSTDTFYFIKNKMSQKMKFFKLFESFTLKMYRTSMNNK